ncbi:MAG: molybdopterin oxidoreductase family protein [Myxococcales bacterium]|nr:molybdopterin oxidoreductase family protein [Myxococcales bacterium]
MSDVHYHACTLCEAICGLEIETEHGRVTRIRGDERDPLSRGHICPKALALKDLHEDPDRLRTPARRTASGWAPVSWDEALDEAATRLRALQRAHGHDAVGAYIGNPAVHNHGALLYGPPLLRALRTKNRFSATSVDQLPHQLIARLMYGHQLLLPIPDIDRTRFLLILGANPLVSNGSLMTAPDFKRRMRAIQERGGAVVVIDPRRTETARAADKHLFIKPGTDALLLAALVHVVLADGLAAPGRLAPALAGLERLPALLEAFTPERVAPRVGVAAGELRQLAREFACAPAAVCYGRLGVSTQSFGTLCHWLIGVLNAITGNLDRRGGALMTTPALDARAYTGRGRRGRWRSRVRGLPEFGGELPVAALAEEILTEGDGQVRGLLTIAGNPVLSTPNGRQLERALERLEFMVSIDFYVNETTRHAHLILPPTTPLERDHFDVVFNALAIRNYARYSRAVFDPAPDARHDWQIMLELRTRLERADGPLRGLKARARREVLGRLGPRGLLDLALRTGPYGDGLARAGDGLTLRRLEREVHGLDLGPLLPTLPAGLKTKSGQIELTPEPCLEDLPRLRALLDAPAPAPAEALALIGRRHLRSNNSWLHNSARLVKGKPRCTLLMHPDDATRRGLRDGQPVTVRSRVGELEAPLELSDEMMPGVVSLPHGWGHARPGVSLSVARVHAGVSLNDLTDEQALDPVCGNAAFNATPVHVFAAT